MRAHVQGQAACALLETAGGVASPGPSGALQVRHVARHRVWAADGTCATAARVRHVGKATEGFRGRAVRLAAGREAAGGAGGRWAPGRHLSHHRRLRGPARPAGLLHDVTAELLHAVGTAHPRMRTNQPQNPKTPLIILMKMNNS